MNADEVALYLKTNPSFFERYADLFSQVYVPHPHGGRAIPLADRQMLKLRDQNRTLEAKLAELMQFGEQNDQLSDRVHRLAVALIQSDQLEPSLAALYSSLRDDFQVPHTAVRLWRGAGPQPEFQSVSVPLREHAARLPRPFCGPNQSHEAAAWFAVGSEHIRSMALIPLRRGDDTFGLMVVASEDPQRFYSDMGTQHLERIGQLASAAIAAAI